MAIDGQQREGTADVSEAAPESLADAMAALQQSELPRGLRLAKLAGVHGLVWLLAMGLFAAAESWSVLSGLWLAGLLVVIAGLLAGTTTTTLIHEWFHFLGARFSRGRYDIPHKAGLFVYDWDFGANNVHQFIVMSVAGSIGGLLSLMLVRAMVPDTTTGGAALFAGAVAGFAFGAVIEWPVLHRVRHGGDPLAELSKIDQRVLTRALAVASGAGLLCLLLA